MAEEDIKYVDVKQEVLEEFNTYSDEIMQTLAWSGGCHSVSLSLFLLSCLPFSSTQTWGNF